MTLTFVKTQVRNENWTWHYFRDEENFEFFVKEPKGEIKERIKNCSYYQENPEQCQIQDGECITLSKEEVAESWYQQFYKKGKTLNQLFAGLESDLNKREKQSKKQHETIISMGESVGSAQESLERVEEIIIEIKEIGQENKGEIFLNKNGVEITENDLKAIFSEYFRGTDLEDVSYQWSEIINLPNYAWCAARLYQWKTLKGAERGEVLAQLGLQFKASYDSATGTNKKIFARLLKENKIKEWIRDKGIEYNYLKEAFKNNPQRVAHYYKLDKKEELFWFGETTEIFNIRFGTNLSPVQVFSFVISGLLGLVFLGYWFTSKVKSMVRNRNTNARESAHQD